MDAAYDSAVIREQSLRSGHVPLIDFNRRSPKDTRSFTPHEKEHYKERSVSERMNARLKDEFGARMIYVRGEGTNKAPGLENAWRKHGSDAVDTKSKFTISKDELKIILSDPKVVQSPVKLDSVSGSFVREVDVGRAIGNMSFKAGGLHTSKITILTDRYGNLINAYPGTHKF